MSSLKLYKQIIIIFLYIQIYFLIRVGDSGWT
jgi:hypothetical protein